MLSFKQQTEGLLQQENYLNHSTITRKVFSEAPSLTKFQNSFGQYLRLQDKGDSTQVLPIEPRQASDNHSYQGAEPSRLPSSRIERVSQLYQTLVFNNVCGFLTQCFPVCQTLISLEDWQKICQQFFLHHHCHSPYFTEINQSFVDYLSQPKQLDRLGLPPYFAELAHYEWVELLVETHPDSTSDNSNKTESKEDHAPTNSLLTVNPTVQNLHYQWPVHTISSDELPDSADDSFFIVYRKNESVEFMQTNALTHALIEFIKAQVPIAISPVALASLLEEFAQMLGYDNKTTLIEFGLPLLEQLSQQGVLFPTFEL